MSVYLIVHGGFSGGWLYREVAQLLRARGHEVFTPTLTGLGERAHLVNPDIDLNTHIQDIVGVLECENLSDVILVGHSYGSIVALGVAERTPERLSYLVYVDAPVTKNGQSFFDAIGEESAKQFLDLANKKGDGWLLPVPMPPEPPGEEAATQSPNLANEKGDDGQMPMPLPPPGPPWWQPQPLKTVTQPLEVKNPETAKIPHGFIHCTARLPDTGIFASIWPIVDRAAEEAKQQGWWYRAVAVDHLLPLTAPKQFADTLLELAM